MKKQLYATSVIGLLCIVLVVGCGSPTPEPTATPEPTVAPLTTDTVTTVDDGSRRFAILSEESTASYIVQEEFFSGALAKYGIDVGNQEVTGSTQEISGELRVRLEDEQAEFISGQFTVDISTLATTRNQRDEWIRENALESNKFPIAVFTANTVEGAPASYTEGEEVTFQLLGDLQVRDVTLPVTFDVTATLEGDKLNAIATTALKITDFGFDPPSFANTLTVSDDFVIRVEIVAQEQELECGCDTSSSYSATATS